MKKVLSENNITLSTRRLKGLEDEIRKCKIHTSVGFAPQIKPRWLDESGRVVSVQGMYRTPETFETALVAVTQNYEKALKDTEKAAIREKASIEYCVANGLDWTTSTAVDIATDHYAESKIKEAIEKGTVYSFDQCDSCSTWTAGENRCSCGNRRVDLTWDGIYPDVYIYPEAY